MTGAGWVTSWINNTDLVINSKGADLSRLLSCYSRAIRHMPSANDWFLSLTDPALS